MTERRKLQNFIGGEFTDAADGRVSDVVDPATGRAYAMAPVSAPVDVDRAMRAAEKAFDDWRDSTPAERQLALLRLADRMEQRADELVRVECANTGKPLALTASEELPMAVDQVRFFAGAARCLEGRSAGEYMRGMTSYVRREPIGVCAQVAPWNYPLLMAVWKLAPALAAGNAVVLKPSDTTPASTLLLAELAAEFLPPGVLNVLTGDRDTGRAMVGHPVPELVSITGSVRAGMEVAEAAAPDLKRTHLELGGKAPVIVYSDADIAAAAAAIAEAGYFNAGQDCTAATRVLVAADVHDEFVAALTERAEATRPGLPDDPDAALGPLNNPRQLEQVSGFVDRLPEHATVHTGGRRADGVLADGYFYQPTVVSGLRQDDEAVQEEIFGPVITVQRFTGEDEAIRLANGVRYGLASSVWTRDHARAMRATRRLDFGCVWVNTHIPLVAEMPHGGFKHSGHGKDLSVYGLEDYTRVKHVMTSIENALKAERRMRSMPAEWAPHERTWMAFPPPNATFGDAAALAQARKAWARVANTLVAYEPVTMLVGEGQRPAAERMLHPKVELLEVPLDDAWVRDSGPTFVHVDGGLIAVDWVFNGWGAQDWASWDNDQHIGRRIAEAAGHPVESSPLVMEGGGFHVDGEGTVLLTETVQLDPQRNPGWSRERVEAEVHARLGTTKAIWLPRGLTRDYDRFGTRGHVDLLATFLRPGTVAVHVQPDPAHPDHAVSAQSVDILRGSTDAEGRRLEVVEMLAPEVLFDADGEPLDYSYINHYVANGVVLLCAFDDPCDAQAAEVLRRAYRGRTVELVDARVVFANGGGIHCITQQQPA